MKLKPLRNLTEALADDLLRQELGESWDVQSQVSLAAVLDKETEYLSEVCFDMLKSARYDFLIVNRESQSPVLAIEVDGPTHAESHVAHRDAVKDALSVASGLAVSRLPIEATRRMGDRTAIQWVGAQLRERQRLRSHHRRDVQDEIRSLTPEQRSTLIEMHGSLERVEESLRESRWRSHAASQPVFPSVSASANRLWATYGIAPLTVIEQSMCGTTPADFETGLWLVVDWGRPDVAGFYVLDLNAVPIGERDGVRYVDWENPDLTKPRFHARSWMFETRGLELWKSRFSGSEDEALNTAAAEMLRQEEIERILERPLSPDALLQDPELLRAANDRLLTRAVGFPNNSILANLAVFDALRQIEGWAHSNLVALM
jgi:hypothetical protein